MEENNKDKKIPRINSPKGPKFNIYWIYGLILVVLIAIQFFPFTKTVKQISFEEFDQNMLQSEDVEKLVVVNKEYVEVYIKQDRLSEDKYKKDVSKPIFNPVNSGPHYRFKIGSVEVLDKKLSDAEAQLKKIDP